MCMSIVQGLDTLRFCCDDTDIKVNYGTVSWIFVFSCTVRAYYEIFCRVLVLIELTFISRG